MINSMVFPLFRIIPALRTVVCAGGIVALLGFPALGVAADLEALSDDEMGAVTAQKGILLSFQYYFNSDENSDGAPIIGSGGAGTAGDGGCSTPNGGSSLTDLDCRFGVQLKGREGEWLVFKNGYASLDMRRLALDASILGDSYGAGTSFESFYNADKFIDVDGSCMLPSGDCSSASGSGLADMAALRLSYPEGNADGNEYNDVRFGLFFEGLAVEPNALSPNMNGWEGTNNGSFMGVNIADNNGHQAGIAFGGDFYLYGY